MSDEKPASSQRPGGAIWRWLPFCVAVFVGAFTVGAGFRLDDFTQGFHLQQALRGNVEFVWWDIYHLAEYNAGQRFSGVLPWWTAEELHIRFLRPVAVGSHILDYWLWPDSSVAMHIHSIVLYVVFVVLVQTLYRRRFDRRKAGLAASIFAGSMVHASAVTWIANRNALLAGIFGVLALLAYQQWCAGRKRGLLAAPFLLLSLLSAEAGVCTLAFFVFVPRAASEGQKAAQSGKRRWWGLLVLVVVVAAWRVAYSQGGFGAVGSGAYVDPVRSPWLFVSLLPERFAWFTAMAIAPVRMVLDKGFPLSAIVAIGPFPVWARAAVGVVFCVCFLGVVRGAVLRENRAWMLSGLVSILPLAAAIPGERVLSLALIGFCPAIASGVLLLRRSGVDRVLGASVFLTHFIVSPALFIGNALTFQPSTNLGESLGGLESRSLALLSAPSFANVALMFEARLLHPQTPPAFTWVLWISEEPHVTREGCCDLVFEDAQGHAAEPFASYFRAQNNKFERGEVVQTLGFDVHVLDVNQRGYVTKARFEFHGPLERPNLVFADWTGEDFELVGVP